MKILTKDNPPPLEIYIDFSKSHVGSASFRGMLFQLFIDNYGAVSYQKWLNLECAELYVNGLHECAKINWSGGFLVFMKDIVDWVRENPKILIHFTEKP